MTRFRELRKKANLTQEELIAQFNARYGKKYTAAAISQFEHDKRIPATESLKDFAEFFGVSIDYLLGRDTSAAPAPAAPPPGLTARDERDIERFDPVKAIFDDSDVRSLARDRLKGVSKEEIALKKQQLKAMVAAMWMKEENEK